MYLLNSLGSASVVAGGGLAGTLLHGPQGVAADAQGQLWIADTGKDRILKVTRVTAVPAEGPTFTSDSTANGASFSRDGLVSTWSLASLFGSRMAGAVGGAVSLPLPLSIRNTQVVVNNVPSPLVYVSPGQINFQVPAETPASHAHNGDLAWCARPHGTAGCKQAGRAMPPHPSTQQLPRPRC